MFTATVVVSVLLAALMTFAAIRKLGHAEHVVRSYLRAGVPEESLDLLAAILLAGAAGLLVGLVWPPVGIAAAAATVGYFVVAIGFHVRAGDSANAGTPLAMALLALAALVLRLLTL